jgi:very-short-patch-repair endonuclease
MSDEQGYIRRVDGLVRPARVVIEFDGSRFHGQPSDVARDSAADARLLAAGFVVLRFGWIDLTRRPESVRATVDRLVLAG